MIKTIWIVWKLWSWKDTVWDYIVQKTNITKYELSQILKNEITSLWIEKTRENLIFLLHQKHDVFGKWYLIREVLRKIDNHWIITWIRLLEQIETLKKHSESYVILVDIFDEIRFDRQRDRGNIWDPKSLEELLLLDKKEENDLNNTIKNNSIRAMSDFIIDNNWDLNYLYTQINSILQQINFKLL